MKHYELEQIATYLSQYKRVKSIERVEDSILKLQLDKNSSFYVSLQRGDSHWFMCDEFERARPYVAPFDVLLRKYFNGSRLERVSVEKGNRIMRLYVTSSSSYKADKYILQLEFTGRNTNAIILDRNNVVQEALRHIDSSVSFRSVKVGESLKPLPPRDFKGDFKTIDDIPDFLYRAYLKRKDLYLNREKNSKLAGLEKKKSRLVKALKNLEQEDELYVKSEELAKKGALVLANLRSIKSYDTKIEVEDFDGKICKIALPQSARTPQEAANIFYNRSKRLRQKATSLYIERENLESKIDFISRLGDLVKDAKSVEALNILVPKQSGGKKWQKESSSYENFYIEGFKIMVGKNEKGNIKLLKDARKSDIWLHIKDIPSAHVIIRTDKQSVPEKILEFAAKLCVAFSKTQKGDYLVDYTQRRNVRIVKGAHVNYVDYKTLKVLKE